MQQPFRSEFLGALCRKQSRNNRFSVSNPDSLLLLLFADDPSSEFSASGKSCSPSPAVLHRDFRESSVVSRGSSVDIAEDGNGGAAVAAATAGAGSAVVDGRDERFPSPFNKQGSMVSLVVSVLCAEPRKFCYMRLPTALRPECNEVRRRWDRGWAKMFR